jgi:hypothetical protein
MPIMARITALWQLLHSDSPRGQIARRRAAALGAMGTFLLVLLAVMGLLHVLLMLVGGVAALATVVAGARALRGRSTGLGTLGRTAVGRARRTLGSAGAVAERTRPRLERAARRGLEDARRSVGDGRRQVGSVSARIQDAAGRQLGTIVREAQEQQASAWSARTPDTRHREALRANAKGVQLRRDGASAQAAEEHRLALAVFRDLGDRRSEALTLNNLALALDRSGDAAALELFEEAATILGELGEEQREGEVIANLALSFRRRGSEERSAEVLEIALGKLEPDSQAYRKVESLRRAS